MSQEPPTFFVYHTDKRRRLRGCMPVFVVLGAVALIGLLALVPIRLKPEVPPARNGRIYFRNDPLLHFNLRLQSPRPFELPRFVDPATNNFGRVGVPVIPQSRLLRVEPPSPFAGDSDAFVLEGVNLLELPPDDNQPGAEPATESEQSTLPNGGAAPVSNEVAASQQGGDSALELDVPQPGAKASELEAGAEPSSLDEKDSSEEENDSPEGRVPAENPPGGRAVPLLPELPGGEEVAA